MAISFTVYELLRKHLKVLHTLISPRVSLHFTPALLLTSPSPLSLCECSSTLLLVSRHPQAEMMARERFSIKKCFLYLMRPIT